MIRLFRPAAVALLSIATVVHAAPVRRPAPKGAATQDWTQVIVRTPSGDRIGNPNAKVKLVEMLSLTCPHCGHFAQEAVPQLMAKYVKRGLVSYEVRLALRDPIDLAAAVVARCDGPKRFFEIEPVLFRTQSDWVEEGYEWINGGVDLTKMSEPDAGRLTLRKSGLDAVLAKAGVPIAHADKCMDNVAEQHSLSAKAAELWKTPGFKGTPGFLIDGHYRDDVQDWLTLDAALAPLVR